MSIEDGGEPPKKRIIGAPKRCVTLGAQPAQVMRGAFDGFGARHEPPL